MASKGEKTSVNMNNDLCIRFRSNVMRFGYEFYGYSVNVFQQMRFCVEPLTLKETEDDALAYPFMSLDVSAVQQLFDDMWNEGIRPSKRLLEEVPLDHLKGEVEWNRKIIELLLPGKKK